MPQPWVDVPSKNRENSRVYRLRHLEASRERQRRYRELHPEAYRESNKKNNERSRSSDRPSCVYFIQCETGFIKIGWASRGIQARLAMIQTGNHEEIRIVGEIFDVERKYETDIHTTFAHLRHRGEWFQPGEDLLEFIREKCGQEAVGRAEPSAPEERTPSLD